MPHRQHIKVNFPQLLIYRDDLNHPTLSGNKLHKLAPNIQFARQQCCETLASFGGAYSNHLHALAWACKEQGLNSIGLVRGELHQNLTPTLKDCQDWGMRLIPIERKLYRMLQDSLQAAKQPMPAELSLPSLMEKLPPKTLLLPEGGSNQMAIESLATAYTPIFTQDQYRQVTHAVCATGTGATVAGLFKAAPKGVKIIGVQAVAEGPATMLRIQKWLAEDSSHQQLEKLTIVPGHLGGFAKSPAELLRFTDAFEAKYDIPLDPIYNGKVLFQLSKMFNEGFFKKSDQVLVIHTGGLQGRR
jgi:1-aminocyclopropane-1-carboxylate deaminase